MTTIDPDKKIQKIRTEEEIRTAISNFIHHKHKMCMLPQIDDDDIILYDAFKELMEAREKLKEIEEKK